MSLTPEQQETIVNHALKLFCENLNQFSEDETDYTHTYEPEQFTSGVGETDWAVIEEPNIDLAFPQGVIRVDATDGDEGGGSVLYVGIRSHFDDPEDFRVDWIMHIFDLTPRLIYTNDEGVSKP